MTAFNTNLAFFYIVILVWLWWNCTAVQKLIQTLVFSSHWKKVVKMKVCRTFEITHRWDYDKIMWHRGRRAEKYAHLFSVCNRNAICTFPPFFCLSNGCVLELVSSLQCFLYKANGLPDIINIISFHCLSSRLKNSQSKPSFSQNAICTQMTMASKVLTFPTMLQSLTWCRSQWLQKFLRCCFSSTSW